VSPAVVIDLKAGTVRLGDTAIAVVPAGPGGALRIGGPAGAVLRPVSFGDRTRAAVWAATCPAPRDALCAALLGVAQVSPGQGDPAMLELMSLVLAGAATADSALPSFVETTLLAARAGGWDPAQLAAADAAEIDRIAEHLGQAPSAWQSLVLSDLAGTNAATGPIELRATLADALLARVVAPPREESGPDPAASQPRKTSADWMSEMTAIAGRPARSPAETHSAWSSSGSAATPIARPAHLPPRTSGLAGPRFEDEDVDNETDHLFADGSGDQIAALAPGAGAAFDARARPDARFAWPSGDARAAVPVEWSGPSAGVATAGGRASVAPGFVAPAVVNPPADRWFWPATGGAAPRAQIPGNFAFPFEPRGEFTLPAFSAEARSASDPWSLADAVAGLLDEECDLRGVDR
jgi:hypothetical protein